MQSEGLPVKQMLIPYLPRIAHSDSTVAAHLNAEVPSREHQACHGRTGAIFLPSTSCSHSVSLFTLTASGTTALHPIMGAYHVHAAKHRVLSASSSMDLPLHTLGHLHALHMACTSNTDCSCRASAPWGLLRQQQRLAAPCLLAGHAVHALRRLPAPGRSPAVPGSFPGLL